MTSQENLSSSEAFKQARLNRLNKPGSILRENPSKEMIAAQQKIDRFCSTRFANAVARGVVLHDAETLLLFANLPGNLMGKADLAGVHDKTTLEEFLRNQGSK